MVPFTDWDGKTLRDSGFDNGVGGKNFWFEMLSLRSYYLCMWSYWAGIWMSKWDKREIEIRDKNLKSMHA